VSDAQPTSRQTYPLPAGIGTQPFAGMARANNLHVVELSETAITVESHEDDLAAFADRLASLLRLCR
jgi:hypothetical protein